MDTPYYDAPDYSGVPLKQLRRVIEDYRGNKPTKVIATRAGIDSREFARISRVAPDTAVIGLSKADRIALALGQNVTDLERRGELNVVPLGSGMIAARRMAYDYLLGKNICPSRERVEHTARKLLRLKRIIIASLHHNA